MWTPRMEHPPDGSQGALEHPSQLQEPAPPQPGWGQGQVAQPPWDPGPEFLLYK